MSDNEKKNITLGDWNKFFQSIRPVFEKHKAILEEKRKRGDFFNVFSVLGIEKLEVKTHSAFIAELLNPNGSHGLGDRFLLEFLKVIPKGEEFIINENTKVTPEFYIGPKQNDDADEGGRLDIIIDNLDSYIIIENKINAEEVKKQLIRYYNYAQKRGNKFILLYLTLDGEEASNISTKGKNINTNKNIKLQAGEHYYPISYRNHIVLWLERCLEIATQHPRVRESITQYIDLIKKLTNTEDMDEKIKTLILNDNNIWITAELLDNNNNIKDSIIKYIIKKNTNKIPSIEWEYDSEKMINIYLDQKVGKSFGFHYGLQLKTGVLFVFIVNPSIKIQ